MPTKIGCTVVSCTGEDEQYRAADLNYHGPTVKGWRSAPYCPYPQEITLQLHATAVLHRIQILAHQYLIPQKIEIWASDDLEYEPSVSPSSEQAFMYLGFITLSDNQATGFRSRELKSVTIPPTVARYVRLRIHSNHPNEKNHYGQVGLVAVGVLGEEVLHDNDDVNNNGQYESCDSTLISNPQYTSPYDDLAFEMYVDKDVAGIMRLMETKKHQAVIQERFEYARKLKLALAELRVAGETLGRYEQEKKQAINLEDYDKAKAKKLVIDQYRNKVYTSLRIEQLLETDGPAEENDDSNSGLQTISHKRLHQQQEDAFPHEEQPPPSLPPQHSVSFSPSPRRRTTSFSDFSGHRPTSPNQLCHSSSQSSFPMSSSTHQFRSFHSETPVQFEYNTPFFNYPALQSSVFNQTPSLEMYQSLPPIRPQPPLYSPPELQTALSQVEPLSHLPPKVPQADKMKSPTNSNASNQSRSPTNNNNNSRLNTLRSRRNKPGTQSKTSYEAYEERMLPALKHGPMHGADVIRECQLAVDQTRKSKLNERERKQAALPISVFGIELVEKFYSKHFADKEDGLDLLQSEFKTHMVESNGETLHKSNSFTPNKLARAAIFLLHRALRDKVYSVYSAAAEAVRFFFMEFVPGRVGTAEVGRSVEKLLPELLSKCGDVTPRIHNMAAHTLLSMADCKEVRNLHIIPVHLSRPLSTSVHPRLALSRLEMVEQLILNHGISTEKQSGLTCRTLAEFGSSGLHHPAEAVRKVSERILLQVYKVNPRLVRKQLPPDDDVTRRNLLYRQLFQEFDFMDLKKRREQQEIAQPQQKAATLPKPSKLPLHERRSIEKDFQESSNGATEIVKSISDHSVCKKTSQIPKRTVNQQTSPITPYTPSAFEINKDENQNQMSMLKQKQPHVNIVTTKSVNNGNAVDKPEQHVGLMRRNNNMSRISEESSDHDTTKDNPSDPVVHFPNLVDSVTVAESKKKNGKSVNSLKYIFPTSYIGTSTTSQETVNKSNTTASFGRINPGYYLGRSLSYQSQASGIPIPRNGFNSKNTNFFSSLLSAGRFVVKRNDAKPEPLKDDLKVAENMNSQVLDDKSEKPIEEIIMPTEINNANTSSELKRRKCIFCSIQEEWQTEEELNNHYWKSCPMLTRCAHCDEVVEISGLTQHHLNDCEKMEFLKKCERCQEAVLISELQTHTCEESITGSSKTRCPLCHQDLENEDSWHDHLMGDKPCLRHPRTHLEKLE